MQNQQQQNKPRSAKAVNPFTGEVLSEHPYLSETEIQQKLQDSWNTFQVYRKTSIELRSQKLLKLSEVVLRNKEKIAKTIALEQGKAIKESRAEVEKAAKHAKYFSEHLQEYSKPEELPSEAKRSYVIFQPLGPIFHVTPFNFPFWLIFKGVIPAIAMGNTVINKNPSICPQTGILAEEAFREAGFVDGEFQNLIVGQQHSELIISSKHIRGVSFTGSSAGGSEIAALGGKYFKKTVMELGGSDPFIVLKDADLEHAADQGWQSRLRNSGQVCTAAKRFIIDESVYEEFKDILVSKVRALKLGDPLSEDTQIGPLAKREGLLSIQDQVERAKKHGAKVLLGGEQPRDEALKNGHFYLPTILEVEEGNPVLAEETFGPVFALIKFRSGDEQEAIRIANDTEYGLAGAIFSKDEARAEELAREVEAGYLAINTLATSGSSVPSGGVKNSGFGRENGRYGAHEFVNIKTIWIGKAPEPKK